jgi:hypothetical protein
MWKFFRKLLWKPTKEVRINSIIDVELEVLVPAVGSLNPEPIFLCGLVYSALST